MALITRPQQDPALLAGLGYEPHEEGARILVKTLILDDPQIKALPTVGIALVEAPAIDEVIYPVFMRIVVDTTEDTYLSLSVNPVAILLLGWGTPGQAPDSYGPMVPAAPMLTAGALHVGYGNVSATESNDWGQVCIDEVYARVVGQPLLIAADNNGANFTGGDSANTLAVTVVYFVA